VLVPPVPGKVKEILVKEGEPVKKDQVLVRLEDQEARDQLRVAEQELVVAKAKLDDSRKATANLVNEHELKVLSAQNQLNRATFAHSSALDNYEYARRQDEQKLVAGTDLKLKMALNAVNAAKKDREDAEAALEKLKSIDPKLSLREPEEALKKAQLEVEAATKKLDMFVIKAPSAGTIFEINYQIGGPCPLPFGDSNSSRAMIFCPDEPLVVRAEVDQEWAMMVHAGLKATLTFRAPGRDYQWTGTVEKVSHYIQRRRSRVTEPDQFNDSRTRECLIRIDPDPKNPVIHGMRMGVQIHTAP
jgi:multidrug resistance efflux pump